MAARVKIEKDRPVLLTEHGIYTVGGALKLHRLTGWKKQQRRSSRDTMRNDLRDLWMEAFTSYSRMCYQACDNIITLYEGNQLIQLEDGADINKMRLIPNGVDIERYGNIKPINHDVPTIAMIGRVVPIKDVKSFIRACAYVKEALGELKVYIMGNTDEDRILTNVES